MSRVPSSDFLTVAGNGNARTGSVDDTTCTCTMRILGRFALGLLCDNRKCLLNFAAAGRLVETNTGFQHSRRHFGGMALK